QLPGEGTRGLMRLALGARGFRKLRIDQQRDHGSIGNELEQQAEALAGDQGAEPARASDVTARPVEAHEVALLDRIATGREHDRYGFVAAMAAKTAAPPPVAAITLTLRPTRSAASAGNRSCRFSAKRYSIAALRPS